MPRTLDGDVPARFGPKAGALAWRFESWAQPKSPLTAWPCLSRGAHCHQILASEGAAEGVLVVGATGW